MKALPSSIRSVIDRVVSLARLEEAAAREVREDLENHFRDGLAAGKRPEDLILRFGSPEAAAERFSGGPPGRPPPTRSTGGPSLADHGADLRLAVRSLVRRPVLALAAVLVLALGIGANTVVITVVNELLLRPLPVEDQDGLVDIWADVPGGNSFLGFSYQDFVAYRDRNTVLEDLAAFTGQRLDLGAGDRRESVVAQLVSEAYFEMLGLGPTLGGLSFPNGAFGEPPVAVLSHHLWVSAFGGDRSVLGRTIHLDGRPVTVLGVGPEGFSGHFIGFPSDLWLPITAADPFVAGFDPSDPSVKPFEMIGRMRTGTAVPVVREALNTIARSLEAERPVINRGHRVGVSRTTGVDHSLRSGVRAFVAILVTVSGLVLLVACLNVGGLLLVRAMSREREIAVRLALGAGPGRLMRQLLAETALLVLVGGVVGTALAVRLNGILREMVARLTGGLGLDLTLEWRVLALTATATLAAAVLASLAPALYLLRKEPASALRARSGEARRGVRLRTVLVLAQVTVSVVLLTATGLLVRSLAAGVRADPGFDADVVADFSLSPARGPDVSETLAELQRRILDEIAAIPGVDGVTLADAPALGVARTPMAIDVPGIEAPAGRDHLIVDTRSVGPRYLSLLGIPMRRGRDFTEVDAREGPPVAVVSQSFVDRFWPGEDPVGRGFVAGDREVTVVGVAADARYLVQDLSPDPLVYVSQAGRAFSPARVAFRAAAPLEVARAVEMAVRVHVPDHGPIRVRTAGDTLREALLPQRVGSVIVGAMGSAALFLATVGLYGLIQFSVTRDTHELGVRLALGGGRRDLLTVVMRKGFGLVGVGTAAGLLLSALAAPGLRGFLGPVSPTDPATYAGVALSFGCVAFLASWLPARRAARIHPYEALRGD